MWSVDLVNGNLRTQHPETWVLTGGWLRLGSDFERHLEMLGLSSDNRGQESRGPPGPTSESQANTRDRNNRQPPNNGQFQFHFLTGLILISAPLILTFTIKSILIVLLLPFFVLWWFHVISWLSVILTCSLLGLSLNKALPTFLIMDVLILILTFLGVCPFLSSCDSIWLVGRH